MGSDVDLHQTVHLEVVRREVDLPVSPTELWEALTSPEALREWFGADVAWELTEGGLGRFVDDDGTQREARVATVDPGHHLGFRWWPAGREDEASDVAYELVEHDDGTRLVVTESRPAAPGAQASAGSATSALACSPWDWRVMSLWCRAARAGAVVRG